MQERGTKNRAYDESLLSKLDEKEENLTKKKKALLKNITIASKLYDNFTWITKMAEVVELTPYVMGLSTFFKPSDPSANLTRKIEDQSNKIKRKELSGQSLPGRDLNTTCLNKEQLNLRR